MCCVFKMDRKGKGFAFGCFAKDACSCMDILQEAVDSKNGVNCKIIT